MNSGSLGAPANASGYRYEQTCTRHTGIRYIYRNYEIYEEHYVGSRLWRYLYNLYAGSMLVCGFRYKDVVVQCYNYSGIMANVKHLYNGYDTAFGSRTARTKKKESVQILDSL